MSFGAVLLCCRRHNLTLVTRTPSSIIILNWSKRRCASTRLRVRASRMRSRAAIAACVRTNKARVDIPRCRRAGTCEWQSRRHGTGAIGQGKYLCVPRALIRYASNVAAAVGAKADGGQHPAVRCHSSGAAARRLDRGGRAVLAVAAPGPQSAIRRRNPRDSVALLAAHRLSGFPDARGPTRGEVNAAQDHADPRIDPEGGIHLCLVQQPALALHQTTPSPLKDDHTHPLCRPLPCANAALVFCGDAICSPFLDHEIASLHIRARA